MLERKLFKTRICVLYRKGHCHRQNCSFAHGDAELRRHNTFSSFEDRRGYRGADLRDRLGRQRSPPRRNSFDRNARDQHPSRGRNSPRSGKRSNWTHEKRQHVKGENVESLRISDGVVRQTSDRKSSSSELKDVNDDQLKQVQSEIDMLEDHKQQLQIYLEERVQEADSLNSKIQELEMQLSTEKEECKRISSKIRKFVKANHRHSRIQDELKRSQARLQRLGDQLGSESRAAVNREDISINILSDEEDFNNHLRSPQNEKAYPSKEQMVSDHPQMDQYKASPSKKRLRAHMVEADENLKQVSSSTTEYYRRDGHLSQMKNSKEIRAEANGINNGSRPLVKDGKPMRRKSNFTDIPSADHKLRGCDSRRVPQATRMAANVVDDTVSPVILPPPVLQNAYLEYERKDDGDDNDDEMVDVDIV